jgi:hypothetical protein
MRRLASLSVVLVGLCTAGGCQRINTEQSWKELGPGDHRILDFTAPAYNQKLKVTISTSAQPVSAWVIKESEKEKVETALTLGKPLPPAAVLGSKESTQKEDFVLDASVPAKIPYSLVVKNAGKGKTDVKVKVTGR